jgi:antitoxin HigA-1
MRKRDFPPTHPGVMLLEEFLKPMKISQYRLAKSIGVPPRRINEIVHGNRSVSADTALRLGRFFSMEAQFWLNLQARYDLETTREGLADRLEREVRPHAA